MPLALPNLFSYSVPGNLTNQIETGKRVLVPFGKKKIYSALVIHTDSEEPRHYQTKEVISFIDHHPVVNKQQLALWFWIADYYMCTPGEVFKAAVPSGLRLESETNLTLKGHQHIIESNFNEKELLLLDFLEQSGSITLQKLLEQTSNNMITTIKSLIDKGIIIAHEKIKDTYNPKTEKFVIIADQLKDPKVFNNTFSNLEKAPKQLEVFMKYLELSGFHKNQQPKAIAKSKLSALKGFSPAAFKALTDKNIFLIQEYEISRFEKNQEKETPLAQLNKDQQLAFESINDLFKEKNVILLHGVTSSGKTEIYLHLMEQQIKKKQQVLYLLPEIALTTQIIRRIKSVFADRVGIYHSKFSDAERVEVWKKMLSNQPYDIIVGVRSSVFLPFQHLGLVIVDEEHENTYKQFDPAPRYHARDTAIYQANKTGAKVLLGTATPSIESYFNAKQNKYGLVELFKRYKEIELPSISIIDTILARKRKLMHSHFSKPLINIIQETLDQNEQIILFQNRRGFSPYIQCQTCGWIPFCVNCDVSMTYHKKDNKLTCHYCGYKIHLPKKCNACGSYEIQTKGFGTEKIEEEIQTFFPAIKTARLDLDTTRSKKNYEKIIQEFEEGKINVLIGTQMVSKGLNFNNVNLVGVLNADNLLTFPDFRAYERSFQLIAQVSGRAGRFKKQGQVIIQSSNPEDDILKYLLNNDYQSMFYTQLNERKQFKYPPYYRLLKLVVRHKNHETLDQACNEIKNVLSPYFGTNLLGPEKPLISRIQKWYSKQFLIKIQRNISTKEAKNILRETIDNTRAKKTFKSLSIYTDVDPY
ncbi:MAG: replication restart helicase PriA [bacterium]